MKDQKRWMTNWIRALVVGTLIAGTVPLSVMAAEKGWVNENGVDSNGSYAKNEWKTSQGVSYYLDGEGNLAKNTWIDGTYYAGEDGSMTKESWIYVDENEGSMKSGWYYLGRNGKVEKNDWKTIEKAGCVPAGIMKTGIFIIWEMVLRVIPEAAGTSWKAMERNVRQRAVFQRILSLIPKMENGTISSLTARQEKVKTAFRRKRLLTERNIILMKTVLCSPAGSV